MVQARVLDRGTLEGDTRYRMDLAMAEKLDPRQVVTSEELLRAMMMEQDATRRVLVRKGKSRTTSRRGRCSGLMG